jgi:hypothetical protein
MDLGPSPVLVNRRNAHRTYSRTGEILDLIGALPVFADLAETGYFLRWRASGAKRAVVTRLKGGLRMCYRFATVERLPK